MSDLIAEIMKLVDAKSDLRIDDAVATGNNTVKVGSSTVAVTLPAIIPVANGDFCQVLTQGPNRVILGRVGGGFRRIGHAYASAAQTGIGATSTFLTDCSVTFTADASRTYRTTVTLPRAEQVTTQGEQRLGILNLGGAVIRQTGHTVPAGSVANHVVEYVESGVSGSQTRAAGLSTGAGTVSTTAGFLALIVVEDIGAA